MTIYARSESPTSYKNLVSFMKLLALLMIINSHSDILFPAKIRVLATGGALGNAIFFAMSGYLTKIKSGITWKSILQRFLRLYLPIYLFCLLTGKFDSSLLTDAKNVFALLIWPTPYWFISAVFFFYVLLLLMKLTGLTQRKYFVRVCIIFLAVYFLSYIFGIENKDVWIVEDGKISGTVIPFKCIYSFFIYYSGFMMREHNIRISGKFSGIVMFVSFVLTYLVKFLMQKNIIPMSWQILNQFTVMFFALSCVCFADEYEYAFCRINQNVLKSINSLSKISLEAYIVQGTIISFIASQNIMFPLNLLLVMISVIVCAYIFCALNSKIIKFLNAALFR